jgi:cellulose synthase/poly-beta-1,6-N-acetylglucosamine synthase-like glycosyltransferase
MNNENKASIILPIVDLNAYVFECLDGCLGLDYDNFEIVLLPDEKINLSDKYNTKRIRVIETGPLTIAKKRNIGLSQSPNADYFAFIDSDAYPEKGWLKNAVNVFNRDKNIWAAGGPNITPPGEPINQRAVGNAQKSILLSGMKNFRKRICASRYCEDLPTCNLIIKKEAMDILHDFDEALITGEDVDLCYRITKKHRKKIYFAEDVVVYHHNRPLLKPFILQRITYGLSVFRVINQNLTFANALIFLPFLFVLFLVFIPLISVIFPFFMPLWWTVILFYLMIALVDSIRYSNKLSELPLTFAVLLTSNLFIGIGTVLAFLKIPVNIKKIYHNYHLNK